MAAGDSTLSRLFFCSEKPKPLTKEQCAGLYDLTPPMWIPTRTPPASLRAAQRMDMEFSSVTPPATVRDNDARHAAGAATARAAAPAPASAAAAAAAAGLAIGLGGART
eukprot:tig00000378_g24519.t1